MSRERVGRNTRAYAARGIRLLQRLLFAVGVNPSAMRGEARLRGLLCRGGEPISRVEFLGEMRGLLHSRALLPLIPPTPFSHKGRRGSLGILKLKTREGTQAPPKKPTPVKGAPLGYCVPSGGTPQLDEAKPACSGWIDRPRQRPSSW